MKAHLGFCYGLRDAIEELQRQASFEVHLGQPLDRGLLPLSRASRVSRNMTFIV